MKSLLLLAPALVLLSTTCTPAQNLRRAVAAADVVLVAKSVRTIPTKTHVVHRLAIGEVLRAPEGFDKDQQISVVVNKRVSAHNRPTPARSMLMCLHAVTKLPESAQLPESMQPYYRMSGHPGSAVLLDARTADDPRVELTRILIASQKGQSSRKTAEQLFSIAMEGDARVRVEAAQSLSERSVLADNLTDMHLGKLLARAAGETDDVSYKIALADICAKRRVAGLVPTLCLGVEQVADERFLSALGRYARHLHGDQAHEILLTRVQASRGKTRQRLLLALGATRTEGALEALLKMHERGEQTDAVEAALKLHGSRRASEAISRRRDSARGK